MVQTLTVWADGTAEINTGTHAVLCHGVAYTTELQQRLNQIASEIAGLGAVQIHSEKDLFRQFEHLVVGNRVETLSFGTTIPVADFHWIMQHVNAERDAEEAAMIAASQAAALSISEDTEPEPQFGAV